MIDLDPCCNSKKYPNIPSLQYYTKADNGLNFMWKGKVFMNPPYGYAITTWIKKLIFHYEKGDVPEAIGLFPASTGSVWFRSLEKHTCCFLSWKKSQTVCSGLFSTWQYLFTAPQTPSVVKSEDYRPGFARQYLAHYFQKETHPVFKTVLNHAINHDCPLGNLSYMIGKLEIIKARIEVHVEKRLKTKSS